jgi:GNAT superfamily N-acetyltransferase
MTVAVVEVAVATTYSLRRSVLRADDPAADVAFAQDGRPGAWHLAALDGDEVVGVLSTAPAGTPWRPERPAAQLRGMAVAFDRQGTGIGSALLDAACTRLRGEGVAVVWANARDTALAFYEHHGFTVVGEGFVTADTGLPHHVIMLDLA